MTTNPYRSIPKYLVMNGFASPEHAIEIGEQYERVGREWAQKKAEAAPERWRGQEFSYYTTEWILDQCKAIKADG